MAATCSALSSLGDIMLVVREEEEETREGGAVELLAAELTAVHAALRDDYLADVPPARFDEQAKAWSGHARELACDAALLARRADGSPDAASAATVKALLERAADLSRRRPRPTAAVDPRRPAAAVDAGPPATEIVGLDAAKDDLIKKLCDDVDGDEQSEQRLKTVSIVGAAGLGKTTLAKMVYDTLRPRFDCGAFVSVSAINPDMAMVFMRMLRQLDDDDKHESVGGEEPSVSGEAQLVDQLSKFLRDRRYVQ